MAAKGGKSAGKPKGNPFGKKPAAGMNKAKGGPNPFGGKQTPPFGGKAPMKGKKK